MLGFYNKNLMHWLIVEEERKFTCMLYGLHVDYIEKSEIYS